jgi:photosystem II stability/assembly factor-like uncharacterized protein
VKNKSIGSLIVLALLAPSCGGGSNTSSGSKNPPVLVKWQTQQRTPTSSDLRAVVFSNDFSGIIAGKDGSFFRTDDGGVTWVQQEIQQSTLGADINALGANGRILIAVGRDLATGNGRAYDGIDATWWQTDPAPSTGAVYVDCNVPYPGSGNVPGNFVMLRSDATVDYSFAGVGGTFQAVQAQINPPVGSHIPPTPPVAWTQVNGILFVGGTYTGFFCGKDQGYGGYPADLPIPPGYPADPGHAARAQIIRTNDFGFSFLFDTINAANIDNLYKMFLTQTPFGALHAYSVGVDTTNHGVMIATNTDVVSLWDLADGPTRPTTAPPFRAVHFPVDDSLGFIVGDGGTIYKVTSTFVVVPASPGPPPVPAHTVYTYVYTPMVSNTTENLYGVSFVSNDFGYAVGDKGTVLKITNASSGNTWTKISNGDAGITFNAASFTDDGKKGIAVGNGGAIYRTLNGGTNWTQMVPAGAVGYDLLGAAVPPGGAGTYAFACGTNNKLFRNPDVWGAGAWVAAGSIAGSGSDTYQAILFPSTEANGICIGARSGSGLVLRTSGSAGDSWTSVTPGSPPAGSYYGLVLNPSGNTLYTSGSAGAISLSTDLATQWQSWSLNIPAPLFPSALTLSSIAAPEGPQFHKFVAASDGKVWRETSGASPVWSATPAAAAPWAPGIPKSLAFQAELSGLVVTGLGQVYTTIDGGNSWQVSPVHSKDKPRAVWMSRTVPGLGYILADDGTILKTVSGGK